MISVCPCRLCSHISSHVLDCRPPIWCSFWCLCQFCEAFNLVFMLGCCKSICVCAHPVLIICQRIRLHTRQQPLPTHMYPHWPLPTLLHLQGRPSLSHTVDISMVKL